ncbi:MAG: ISNCY family transposase [Chlorobium sp.]|nr:ISNCY family transposase [Chlorobium sp.]
MRRTEVLQEIVKMRFTEAYGGWQGGRLTQAEAAQLLGVCERTFRRYIQQYEGDGMEGLNDKRLTQASHRRAPVDETIELIDRYRNRHQGWNAKHFYSWYRRDGGNRSYTWVKNQLQESGLIIKTKGRGKHRKRRDRSPWPGMMLHQDGSTHQWIPGAYWDLIVTMDDATSEHYSMFFVEEEGTASSFRGVQEVIEKRGLFSSFYSDRGSHYWHTPKAGGKVDKSKPTQFGQAMKRLGIEMIAAYSPEARGRSERMFSTHQGRLSKELAAAGITDMVEANRYLQNVYMAAFNAEFMQPAMEEGSAFIPYIGKDLKDILCEQHERTVRNDNCVEFEKLTLQIPADHARLHYVKVKVRVHCYPDGKLAIFHGPRCLVRYSKKGTLLETDRQAESQLRGHG